MPLDRFGQYVPDNAAPPSPGPAGGGAGSPEGVVIGSPFQRYLNTSTDEEYYKKTGIGTNTGWELVAGTGGGGGGDLSATDIDTSANLRGIVTDESGTGALIFAGGALGAATATTASADDSSTKVATTAYVQGELTAYDSDARTLTSKTLTTPIVTHAEATIASATTTDLSGNASESITISGTTTITGLGTVAAGVEKRVQFSGALILTHHATQLILLTGANITTIANDKAVFRSLGAGNWRMIDYTRFDGTPLVLGSSGTGTGTLSLGDGSSNTYSITPQSMSADVVFKPDTAPADGFPYHTVSGSNSTESHVTLASPAVAALSDGATITQTMDVKKVSQNATVTLGGNRTLAFSGLVTGMSGILIVKQDGTGSRTLALPATSKVINGGAGAITLTTAASSIDVLSWIADGTNILWTYGKNFT